MKHFLIASIWLVLLSLTSGEGSAQQLNMGKAPVIDVYPFFNASFIKNKKVRFIETEVMLKIPNQKIRYSNRVQKFEFDRSGNVMVYQNISPSGVNSKTSYFLNKTGLLAIIHSEMPHKDALLSFFYDEKGRVVTKETANGKNPEALVEEKFTYEDFSATQFKKYYLNDENLTYKHEVVDLDSKGRVVESRARYIRGVNREYSKFGYAQKLLVSVSINVKNVTRREEKYVMSYDDNEVLQFMQFRIDGAPIYRYEYLYEDELIIAILRKDLKSEEIQITKLKYRFF